MTIANGHSRRLGPTAIIAKGGRDAPTIHEVLATIAKSRQTPAGPQRREIQKQAITQLELMLGAIDARVVAAEIEKGVRTELPTRITKAASMSPAARLRQIVEEREVAKRNPSGWEGIL